MPSKGRMLFWTIAIATLFIGIASLMLMGGHQVSYYFKNTEIINIMETKDVGKMVSIGGHAFKQTTYHDEDDVCWKIYTGGRRGNSAFALPCPQEGQNGKG